MDHAHHHAEQASVGRISEKRPLFHASGHGKSQNSLGFFFCFKEIPATLPCPRIEVNSCNILVNSEDGDVLAGLSNCLAARYAREGTSTCFVYLASPLSTCLGSVV